ncbi:kit ligand isoform X4 [Alligator mississippiensis]|uniref:kit ligand isoform X4 n=1 Tax=Alligator mississippiensis TaxID=8496 RepID=UPI0009072F9A|nr:kit ligand isoform X4 [Alligator mississippiensis]
MSRRWKVWYWESKKGSGHSCVIGVALKLGTLRQKLEPNHCWLYLMVPEFSKSLNNLLHKFSQISDVLSNHSIINNLTRIIYDLMECLALDKNKNFKQESDHLYKEGKFIPEEFFRHFNNIIEAYKTFSETSDYDDCVLPSTETPVHDSKVTETKPFSLPPVAASSLKNNNDSSVQDTLGYTSSSSLQGISIALPSLFSLLIGLALGAVCWKKTHPKSKPESEETERGSDCREENEISMLQQKEKELLQV